MPDYISALDLFTIGIGPSSSHTVGPMRAALLFAQAVRAEGHLGATHTVTVTLFGSLGATGPGHGTTNAIVAGLSGDSPELCNPEQVLAAWDTAILNNSWKVLDKEIAFNESNFSFQPLIRLEKHSNAMKFRALDVDGNVLLEQVYYSVGGGFVEADHQLARTARPAAPHPFINAEHLLGMCDESGLTIAELAYQNEVSLHGEELLNQSLSAIWLAMENCIEQGLKSKGVLPGYLQVTRRAADMAERLAKFDQQEVSNEWLQAYAIAVNEQNASGMRVVTAPTNGAAGIIPAVGYYAMKFKGVSREVVQRDYLLVAAAVGSLYKRNASISGAEAGCQGEVGSACSMAAAGLAAVLGGTSQQIENAAEIAMEHNLGLTCDPVGGFVQMPCIERNAIAAGTALSAVRLAMLGDGSHKISLDTVIETMRQTGIDMSSKYKETSLGGLAVNVVEC
ncbi:MAG: L-serine ammonia-lyase [Micrococcales bacterium]|nr:L-serine ammonia-lyase [Micrococcales bacterium]